VAANRANSGSGAAEGTLVSLEGVTKHWGDRLILDAIDLELRPGTVVHVGGGNGAGKTTLLRIASGVILPEEGRTCFRGADIERDLAAYQKDVGLLSAGDRGLYARLTVSQNLDFWGGLAALSRRRRRERISRVLADFEIADLVDQRVDRLSMGQRQRVRLAMTFLHEPAVAFLDEPKTSLDDPGTKLLDCAIERQLDNGGAILVVSPEVGDTALGTSWVLDDGRLHKVSSDGPILDGEEPAAGELATTGARS